MTGSLPPPSAAVSKPRLSARAIWAAHSSGVRKSCSRKIVGWRRISRRMACLLHETTEHDIGAQNVLSAAQDRSALVQFPVDEDKDHAALGANGDIGVFGEEVEVGFASGEVVVEIDHERELAFLIGV